MKLLEVIQPEYAIRLNGNISYYKNSFEKLDLQNYETEGMLNALRKHHRFIKFQILFALINNEISITGGYKYKKKSQVRVNVGNSNFKLEIKDNFAWLVSYDDEIRMIRAMKKSNKAKVIGISSRGNKTTDTYSLMGFTNAYNAARKNCRK